MEFEGARALVAGATGVLGGRISRDLHAEGAHLMLAGRNSTALESIGSDLGAATASFDARDSEDCSALITRAVEELGGLDALFIAFGVVAFGDEAETDDAVTGTCSRSTRWRRSRCCARQHRK